jgi:hypothetical protein
MTQVGDILNQTTGTHNNKHIQQRPIEKNQEQTKTNYLRTHLPQRCGRSISTMLLNPNKKWTERKKSQYLYHNRTITIVHGKLR